MDNDIPINEELTALEDALRSLEPIESRIDRDELMYRAGRASVTSVLMPASRSPRRLARWLWPATTVTSLATAVIALTWPGMEDSATPPLQVVTADNAQDQERPITVDKRIAFREPTYLLQRDRAVEGQIETIDRQPPASAPPIHRDQLFRELMEETLL